MVNVDKIKLLAKQNGIKLGFICEKLNLSEAYFRDVKKGKTKITEERLKVIADILNTTPEYLRNETDIKEKPFTNTDEELAEYVRELRDRPELRTMLDLTKSAPKSDIEQVVRVVGAMLDKGDIKPENAKIAAFGGTAKKPQNEEEAQLLAEIERLTQRINELENK